MTLSANTGDSGDSRSGPPLPSWEVADQDTTTTTPDALSLLGDAGHGTAATLHDSAYCHGNVYSGSGGDDDDGGGDHCHSRPPVSLTLTPAMAHLAQHADYSFRRIRPADRQALQTLHEEWFPVVYQDEFYEELVQERLAGKKLYTCLAVAGGGADDDCCDEEDEEQPSSIQHEIASCLVGSFVHYSKMSRHTRTMLLPNHPTQHKRMFYIMTLGTATNHRNAGLATAMVEWAESLVQQDSACGGLYLHVITYNHAAIRFYQRLGFHCIEEIPGYYEIDGQKYASFVFARYSHGNRGHLDIFQAVSRVFFAFLRQLTYWIPTGRTQRSLEKQEV